MLEDGGSALDAVERAVRELEGSGIFGAGRGSALNEDGVIELDAGMMDGAALDVGSVVVRPWRPARDHARPARAREPVRGLRRAPVRGSSPSVPASRPATRTTSSRTASGRSGRSATANPDPDWVGTMFGHDTVGAIVLDRAGNLAAGTSTGGMPFKPPGRVGDSPFIGAGLYADNETGAVSTTGHGERIIPLVLAKTAADLMGGGLDPQAAADRALATLGAASTPAAA